jgi:DNA repair exonuclease SbcCD nuclease subunit
MPSFQFIHAADLHLGAPFVGLHQNNPRLAQMADDATYAAFEKIIQLAITRKVLFVLFAGDIYDADYPNLKAQLRFRDGVRQLDKAGIASCVIRGNHDHGGSVRAKLDFPDSYFEFAPSANEPHLIHQNGIPVAAIYGYSYPQRAVTENILRHYNSRPEDQKYFRIGMLHGNVGGDVEHDNYAPCSVAQLKEMGIDYWALGHVHQAKVLSDAPAIAYPGTPQGLSPRETGAHGCYLVTAQDHRCTMEFVTADSLRWVDLEYDISGVASEEELLRDLGDLLSEQCEKAKCALIARIDFTGRGEQHHSLQKPGALAEMQDYFQQQMTEDIFINRLQDLTRPDFDLEKKREENSILGDYLRLSQSVNSDDELRRKVLLALAEVVDHLEVKSALEIHQSDEWLLQQLPQLIKLAEARGADLLMGEG